MSAADARTFVGGEQPVGTLDTGSRHYEGQVEKIISWKCPACGTEQVSDFSLGCPTCGAGTAQPRHVGVPPSTKRVAPIEVEWPKEATYRTVPAIDQAFDAWLTKRGGVPTEIEHVLHEAWVAAVRWYQAVMANSGGLNTISVVPPEDLVPMPRALLRVVVAQLEGMSDLPEDQQSPELQTLIAQLKELVES